MIIFFKLCIHYFLNLKYRTIIGCLHFKLMENLSRLIIYYEVYVLYFFINIKSNIIYGLTFTIANKCLHVYITIKYKNIY